MNKTQKGHASPSTPKVTKRNLSNTSTSPNQNEKKDKKTKVFSSPNRYAPLSIDDNNVFTSPSKSTTEDPDSSPHQDQNAEPLAPAIHIKNIQNFSAFNTVLKNITSPKGFTCKSTSSYLIVQPSNPKNYNVIVDYLHETNASFHSYTPPSHRTHRVVIRNLHYSTLHTEIKTALSEQGHSVKNIYNAKNKNQSPLPIFFVDVRPQDNNNDIYDITYLLNTKVIIEKPNKKRRGPPQCHNCQAYGHTKNYCNHDARCVKCGENHHTNECTKDRNSPAKCALCTLDHTANFKGCPAFELANKKSAPKIQPAKASASHTQPKTKSYAEATNSQNMNTEQIPNTDSNTFSNFISTLNSLISPLISLLSSVLNALITKSIISP